MTEPFVMQRARGDFNPTPPDPWEPTPEEKFRLLMIVLLTFLILLAILIAKAVLI